MKLENISIGTLKLIKENPRQMDDVLLARLEKNIKSFGFVEPLVINQANEIIGGNQRYKVAVRLGYEKVPCYRIKLDKKKALTLMLALNRITGDWNTEKLEKVFRELDKSFWKETGFDKFEIEDILSSSILSQETEINLPEKQEIYEIDLIFRTDEEYIAVLECYRGKNAFEKTENLIKCYGR